MLGIVNLNTILSRKTVIFTSFDASNSRSSQHQWKNGNEPGNQTSWGRLEESRREEGVPPPLLQNIYHFPIIILHYFDFLMHRAALTLMIGWFLITKVRFWLCVRGEKQVECVCVLFVFVECAVMRARCVCVWWEQTERDRGVDKWKVNIDSESGTTDVDDDVVRLLWFYCGERCWVTRVEKIIFASKLK